MMCIYCSSFEDTNVVLLPPCELPCESRRSDAFPISGGGDNSFSSCCSCASTESVICCGPDSRPVTDTLSCASTRWKSRSRVSVALKSRVWSDRPGLVLFNKRE
jgi:hypothetical protein